MELFAGLVQPIQILVVVWQKLLLLYALGPVLHLSAGLSIQVGFVGQLKVPRDLMESDSVDPKSRPPEVTGTWAHVSRHI